MTLKRVGLRPTSASFGFAFSKAIIFLQKIDTGEFIMTILKEIVSIFVKVALTGEITKF